MDEVIVMCPAKVNLSLNILGKVGNMHLLRCLNQSVDLYDFLVIKLNSTGRINITCNNSKVPLDSQNSCFKAAYILREAFNLNCGFDIDIAKNIPIGAGLGGESTDAAGVLLAINKMLNLEIPLTTLMTLGFKIGADVPFCLNGGTCIVEHFGEDITQGQIENYHLLIVNPNHEINTKAAFAEYDRVCTSYTDNITCWIGYNDFELIAPNPKETAAIKRYLIDYGAYRSCMTGSGPAVVGMFTNNQKRIKAYRDLKKYFENYKGYLVHQCNGIEVIDRKHMN